MNTHLCTYVSALRNYNSQLAPLETAENRELLLVYMQVFCVLLCITNEKTVLLNGISVCHLARFIRTYTFRFNY